MHIPHEKDPLSAPPPNDVRFPGLWKGRVEQRCDPARIYRLRLRILGVHDDSVPVEHLPWASPASGFAWRKGGFFGAPPLGEIVWCMFEGGHHENPVWIGGWWAHGENADGQLESKNVHFPRTHHGGERRANDILRMEDLEGLNEEDQPNNFGFASPLGKHLELDDRLGREKIKLSDQIDNFLWVDSGSGSITLEAGRALKRKAERPFGLTLNSQEQVAQIYTHLGFMATFDDKNGWLDLRTPAGQRVRLSDSGEVVEVWSKNGRMIQLDDKNKRVLVRGADQRFLSMDDTDEGHVAVGDGESTFWLDDAGISLLSEKKLMLRGASVQIISDEGDIDIIPGGIVTLATIPAPTSPVPPVLPEVQKADEVKKALRAPDMNINS